MAINKSLDRNNASKLLAKTAEEKLKDSTIHGCGMFFRSENSGIRIMWICFGLAALGYLVYLMTTSIIEYNKYEVRVEISKQFELPAIFPAITICNVNPLNEEYAYNYTLSKDSQAACFKLKNGTTFSECIGSTDAGTSFDNFIKKMKRIIANDKTLTDYDYYWYGFQLEGDMMISCKFNGITSYANNFTKFWDNNFGNCYTFNYGNLEKPETEPTANPYSYSNNYAPYNNATLSSFLQSSTHGSDDGLQLQLAVGS